MLMNTVRLALIGALRVPLLFLSAFVLGLAFAAPPGAVTAEALRRGLDRGFRSVLFLEFGSLVGDALWIALALLGAAGPVQHRPLRLVLGLAGACFLMFLGWNALRDAFAGAVPKARDATSRGDFTTGAVLSLANPYGIAMSLSVGGTLLATGVADPRPGDFAVFFLGFMGAMLFWCFFIASLITAARRVLRPAFFRWVNLICGLVLLLFAARLFLSTVTLRG